MINYNQAVRTPNEVINFYLTEKDGHRHADYMDTGRMIDILEICLESKHLSTQAREKAIAYVYYRKHKKAAA